jgi:hypothetical protein
MDMFNGALLYLTKLGSQKCSIIEEINILCYAEDKNILFVE